MPDLTVSTDIDTLLSSASATAARTNLGLGSTDAVEFGAFIPPSGTTAEIDSITTATVGQVMIDTDSDQIVRFSAAATYGVIGTLNSSATIQVAARSSPATNGLALEAAYAQAKTLTPNGLPLSAGNRATLFVHGGVYALSTQLLVDTEFVDIQAAVFESYATKRSVTVEDFAITVSANDVLLHGLVALGGLNIVGDKPLQVFNSCLSTTNSFGGGGQTASGTFVNCLGTDHSFGGGGGTASGTFINCTAAANSFGGSGNASGTFKGCTAGDYAFGGYNSAQGTASGSFSDCVAGLYSFGSYGIASGEFTRCVGGDDAFAKGGTLSGHLISCRTSTTFETVSGIGKTRFCLDGTLTENTQG